MITIFRDKKGTGEYVVQSTAIDAESFLTELASALPLALKTDSDSEVAALGILSNAMPIMYRLSGYKADTVHESRTLTCGVVSPGACDVIASAGR